MIAELEERIAAKAAGREAKVITHEGPRHYRHPNASVPTSFSRRPTRPLPPPQHAIERPGATGRWVGSTPHPSGNEGAPSSAEGRVPISGGLRHAWSVPPKVLEAVGRHFGVPDRVLDVLVPEVVLQGPRVVAIVGELEPAGMAKHVRVDREWHLGGLPEALDEPMETDGTDWPAALGNEYVGVSGVIAA